MEANFKFIKHPTAKNLQRRSVSFQHEEISFIQPNDWVNIIVMMPSGEITLNLSGKYFLTKLTSAKKGSSTFKVFKF